MEPLKAPRGPSPPAQAGGIAQAASLRDHRRWDVCGISLCRGAYCQLLNISARTLRNYKKDILEGHLEPRASAQGARGLRASPQADHADAWLHYAYWHVAEPLADSKQVQIENAYEDDHVSETIQLSTEAVGIAGADLASYPARHLPPGKIEELFELYRSCSGEHYASKTCFEKVYRERWRSVLTFRAEGQHARCTTCAKLSRLRLLAQTSAAKQEVRQQKEQHVERVRLDRAYYARMQRLSIESTRARPGPPESAASDDSVLTLTVDGMNQAKFRLPRNLGAVKLFEKAWRPQEHCVGVLAAGVVDAFYLLGPETKNDSNMVCTLLSHTLDVAQEKLRERGRAMPQNMLVACDNTARENRNQWLNKWASTLMLRNLFRSVTFAFMEVGHTRNNLDQKFSVIATGLASQEVFETPED